MEKSLSVGSNETHPAEMQKYGITDPQKVVDMAKEVNKYVSSNNLSTTIQGGQYVLVEGWQFAASLLGLVGKAIDFKNESTYEVVEFKWKAKKFERGQYVGMVEKTHKTQKYKYFATAAFYDREGKEISKAFAMCSNEEVTKHTFDEYSILSMAQTRALGKAARISLAFLIKAAGYQPTPAEEMEAVANEEENAQSAEQVELEESIQEDIDGFTDHKELVKWAGEHELSQNVIFRRAIMKKKTELLQEIADGKKQA